MVLEGCSQALGHRWGGPANTLAGAHEICATVRTFQTQKCQGFNLPGALSPMPGAVPRKDCPLPVRERVFTQP
eukprot:1161740-Pelagomonas_calceolata.AAC.10